MTTGLVETSAGMGRMFEEDDRRNAAELAAEVAAMEEYGDVPPITSRAEARAACEWAAGLGHWRTTDITYWTRIAYRASTRWTRTGWRL